MNSKNYTILILMKATSQWQSLSNDFREKFIERKLEPVFSNAEKDGTIQFLSSKHFHTRVSDFIVITAPDLDTYQSFMKQIHDTRIYAEPYFEIVDIIPGQENVIQSKN
jgi:Darcynin, domain of unknown function